MYKSIRRASQDSRINLIVIRYLTTAWIALELFLFARILGPESFGHYALALQVVGLLTLIGAGSGAGYVYAYYKEESKDIENVYLVGSIFQYGIGGLGLLLLSLLARSYLVLSSIILLIKIPYLVSEPMLRVRNQFTLPTIGRASGSIATIFIILGYFLLSHQMGFRNGGQTMLNIAIVIMLLGNVIGHLIYYVYLANLKYSEVKVSLLRWNKIPEKLTTYWKLILAPSWMYTLSSILFVSYTFIDRFFLEHYYVDTALSVYSLAWQIAQSVLLILTSLNVISGVRIGESQTHDPLQLVKTANHQLHISTKAGVFSLVIALLGSWLLSISIYHDYKGLLLAASFLSFGYLSFGVAGSITMVLFFERKLFEVCLAYGALLLIAFIGNIAALSLKLSYLYPLACSSAGLVLVSVFLLLRYLTIAKKYTASV